MLAYTYAAEAVDFPYLLSVRTEFSPRYNTRCWLIREGFKREPLKREIEEVKPLKMRIKRHEEKSLASFGELSSLPSFATS